MLEQLEPRTLLSVLGPPHSLPVPSPIQVSMRYGSELVVTIPTVGTTVKVSEDGGEISLLANGILYASPLPTTGLFIYPQATGDSVVIDSSVTMHTTVEAIDGNVTSVVSNSPTMIAWIDSNDSFSGLGIAQYVSAYAGGVPKIGGSSLPNPTDSGSLTTIHRTLFGREPLSDDVHQGSIGDCWLMSTLAAFANTNSTLLQSDAVDMGDGTATVKYLTFTNQPVYVRVSDSFASGFFPGGLADAYNAGSIWPMILEKSFAYFRYVEYGMAPTNTYASLNSGWMGPMYTALGIPNNATFFTTPYNESSFYTMVSSALASGRPVTFGTYNPQMLVNNHAYSLMSVYQNATGTHYVVRNPWGSSGDSLENGMGYATLTWAQVLANFYDGVIAL